MHDETRNVFSFVFLADKIVVVAWNHSKNILLKASRGISFDELVRSEIIGLIQHPSRSNQMMLLFKHNDYIWVVPYVLDGEILFLKTFFASRKYTRMWLRGEINEI